MQLGSSEIWIEVDRLTEGASKLARSAGASPVQVRPSKPPGSECCVRRRRRRTRSVHSGCVGCGSEPRNDLLAGAETVFMVERNMSDAGMRGIVSSRRGRGPHHVHKDRVGTWELSCLTRSDAQNSFAIQSFESGHARDLPQAVVRR